MQTLQCEYNVTAMALLMSIGPFERDDLVASQRKYIPQHIRSLLGHEQSRCILANPQIGMPTQDSCFYWRPKHGEFTVLCQTAQRVWI